MDIHTRHYNDVAILSLNGRLDAVSAPRLAGAIAAQIEAGYARLVVDLKKVDFLNSVGIKAMIQGAQLTRREGGDFRIASTQSSVKQVLVLAGVHTVIKMYPNVVGATASYFPGPMTDV